MKCIFCGNEEHIIFMYACSKKYKFEVCNDCFWKMDTCKLFNKFHFRQGGSSYMDTVINNPWLLFVIF